MFTYSGITALFTSLKWKMRTLRHWKCYGPFLFLLVFTVSYLYYIISNPISYWDSLPYMGAVVALTETDPQHIHTLVYSDIDKYAGPVLKYKLTEAHPFCHLNASDPLYFYSQLPFFSVKWLYVSFAWVFYRLGVPLYFAVYVPVWLSAITFVFVLFRFIQVKIAPFPAALYTAVFLLLPFNLYVFSIASPDAFTGLFLLVSAYFYFYTKNRIAVHLFLCLSVLTRPEMGVFYFLLMLTGAIRASLSFRGLRELLPPLACFVFVYFTFRQSGYVGSRMFYRSFIDLMPAPANMPGITWSLYLQGVQEGIRQSLHDSSTYLLLACMLPLILLRNRFDSATKHFVAAFMAYLPLKMALHPVIISRFSFVFIDIFLVILLLSALRWIHFRLK